MFCALVGCGPIEPAFKVGDDFRDVINRCEAANLAEAHLAMAAPQGSSLVIYELGDSRFLFITADKESGRVVSIQKAYIGPGNKSERVSEYTDLERYPE